MGCKPQIQVEASGGYPPHIVEIINRMGEPGDVHLNVRIFECSARPEVVGRTYRMPVGGHGEVAAAAPHIKEILSGLLPQVATVATPRASMPADRIVAACKASTRALVLFRAGSPPQMRRVGIELAGRIGQEITIRLVNIDTVERFATARVAGHWWHSDNPHPAVAGLLESLIGESGGPYEIVDLVEAP